MNEKITVLLVEPGKYPKPIEIEDTLEAMQEVVGGDIEEYMPFEDEVAIICNEEGKMNGSIRIQDKGADQGSPLAHTAGKFRRSCIFKLFQSIDIQQVMGFFSCSCSQHVLDFQS